MRFKAAASNEGQHIDCGAGGELQMNQTGERNRVASEAFRKREIDIKVGRSLGTTRSCSPWHTDHTERSLKPKEINRKRKEQSEPERFSFFILPALIALSLCLHLHSALNKVLRDTRQVARRGAEFQSGPSELPRMDGGERWRRSLKRNFISAARSVGSKY